jgi:rhodanese-related sulfurtransferase
MNSFGFDDEESVPRIPREAMEEIIEDVANGGREDSGYVIIDVRGHDEVAHTGKLNDVVHTLPLPYIAEGALSMDEDDFEEQFGFAKPSLDETIVFTCKAGIRSASAAKLAQMAGYTDILDYAGKFRFATVNEFQSNHKCLSSFQPKGGSNEWFS